MTERTRKSQVPSLKDLYKRHRGLTEVGGPAFAEAAAVCLSRHHSPPVDMAITTNSEGCVRAIGWDIPSRRQLDALNNVDDATRDGAYAVCLAVIEAELGLLAIRRAETLTGADYYLAPSENVEDLETAYRVEISGLNLGGPSEIRSRLRQKLDQARRGDANLPAIASVVGFREKIVLTEYI